MPMKTDTSSERAAELRRRKAKYTNLLIILAIMIVISVLSLIHSENTVVFDWSETQVQITDPDGISYTIVYSDVVSLELMERPNYGTCITGKETSSWLYGNWENDVWGSYTLCASTGSNLCIVACTADEIFVLSYESDNITSALYESLAEFVAE